MSNTVLMNVTASVAAAIIIAISMSNHLPLPVSAGKCHFKKATFPGKPGSFLRMVQTVCGIKEA